MNRDEPVSEGKIRRLHHRPTSEGSSGSALFTLKLFNALHPVMGGSFTVSANNALSLAVFPESIPAGLLVGVHVEKLYKLHVHCFDTKLQSQNITYLRLVHD